MASRKRSARPPKQSGRPHSETDSFSLYPEHLAAIAALLKAKPELAMNKSAAIQHVIERYQDSDKIERVCNEMMAKFSDEVELLRQSVSNANLVALNRDRASISLNLFAKAISSYLSVKQSIDFLKMGPDDFDEREANPLWQERARNMLQTLKEMLQSFRDAGFAPFGNAMYLDLLSSTGFLFPFLVSAFRGLIPGIPRDALDESLVPHVPPDSVGIGTHPKYISGPDSDAAD